MGCAESRKSGEGGTPKEKYSDYSKQVDEEVPIDENREPTSTSALASASNGSAESAQEKKSKSLLGYRRGEIPDNDQSEGNRFVTNEDL